MHIPDQKRRKLDNKAVRMILVGYDEQSKAYRCFNPATRKVTISRNVRFVVKEGSDALVEFDVADDQIVTESGGGIEHASEGAEAEENLVRRSDRPNKGIPSVRFGYEANLALIVREPKTLMISLLQANPLQ